MKAQQALDLLSPIPKEDFIESLYTDGKNKCCAIGHLCRLTKDPTDYHWSNCSEHYHDNVFKFARVSVEKFLTEQHNLAYKDLASINNWAIFNGYNEDNPKDRVVHLLTDMIKAGY